MEAIGLGQGQLATRAGLDRATLNRVENAQQSVSVDRAFVLAEALGVRLSDLIGAAEDHAGWRVHI
jgi:transcriptional regulator with XRE-family HTH domain